MTDLPPFVVRITSDLDDEDVWEVLQKCVGDARYYVTIHQCDTETEAQETIRELEAL